MTRGVSIGRLQRFALGNIHTEGVEYCAQRVRERALQERRIHSGVSLLVSDNGIVYAPESECLTATFVADLFPWWLVGRYRFDPPRTNANRRTRQEMPADDTTPTVDEIADDIRFHSEQRRAAA